MNGTNFRLSIVIITAGVPELIIGLGWFEQMTGYALSNYQMASGGNDWMVIGVLIYVIKIILYACLRHDGSVD